MTCDALSGGFCGPVTHIMVMLSIDACTLMVQHGMGRSCWLLQLLLLLLILKMVVPTTAHPCCSAVCSNAHVSARLQVRVSHISGANTRRRLPEELDGVAEALGAEAAERLYARAAAAAGHWQVVLA